MQGVLFYFFRRVRGGGSCVLGKKGHLSVREKRRRLTAAGLRGKEGGFLCEGQRKNLKGGKRTGQGRRGEKNDFVRVGKARKI